MQIERRIMAAILKLTRKAGSIGFEEICREARVPRSAALEVLNALYSEGYLMLEDDVMSISGEQRLRIATRAVDLGFNIEEVSRFLTWSEFEVFSKMAFELSGFRVVRNFRFTWLRRRWEVDIVGVKRPIIISADCKHWRQRWSGSASIKAVEDQIKRTKALAEASERIKDKISIVEWKYAYFVPAVLSLFPSQYKFYMGTPIVPVLQLRDFIENISVRLGEINHFYITYA